MRQTITLKIVSYEIKLKVFTTESFSIWFIFFERLY